MAKIDGPPSLESRDFPMYSNESFKPYSNGQKFFSICHNTVCKSNVTLKKMLY